jgi:photosystem II stability/assembly factor-like uncharacterized protein
MNNLNAVTFLDGNNGWIAGDWGTILKTTNGGASWTSQSTGTSRFLRSLCFVNSNTGYAAGTFGTIIKTSDGGSTWSTLESYGESATFNSIFFIDENTGFAVGDGNFLMNTTDGGITWNQGYIPANVSLRSVYFQDINTGYIVGESGSIFLTNDGGITWTQQLSGTTQHLSGVVVSNHVGFAVGNFGTILKTDEVGVWVNNKSSVKTIKITPNPAADQVNVDIPGYSENGILTISTITSQEIRNIQITNSKITLDISNLPAGIYLVRFTGNNSTRIGKLVVKR